MSKTVDIHVKHVTRVEGHGNIRVCAKDGTIEKLEWQVPEAPRFFEAMVRGRKFEDIQTIVSRICGICSVTHSLAAIKAIENGMGIEISEQTDKLRILTHYGEQLESHILHVGYLVTPDLLGQKSVVPVVGTHPDVVNTVIDLHRLGNLVMTKLAGRKTHPVRLVPGGFSMLPTAKDLRELRQEFVDAVPKLTALAEVVASLAGGLPDFSRDTEYIGLKNDPTYPFYHGKIASTDTAELTSAQDFEEVVNEYMVSQSTAKWAKWHRDSYMVGALARFNLNGDKLMPLAKKTAEMLGLKQGCCNPYMNSVVQVVESVQVVERSIELIDEILTAGIKHERPSYKVCAGNGAAAVEAPRGILFHRYEFDDNGLCVAANISIPTNQNHGNIQKDFEALVPQIIDLDQDVIRQQMEMLVRAYDPCISCSTHYLDVEFV
jgi:coenzyme F420-reducing hydrogenase alpha subunit